MVTVFLKQIRIASLMRFLLLQGLQDATPARKKKFRVRVWVSKSFKTSPRAITAMFIWPRHQQDIQPVSG